MNTKKSPMFDTIVSTDNLTQAFLELAVKFDESGRTKSYSGIDGQTLDSHDSQGDRLIAQAQKDLRQGVVPLPVSASVLKKDGKNRDIYTYTLRDRLKAQAIYRVLLPLIDAELSPHLFSYRPEIAHDTAVRHVARRHRRWWQWDTVARLDVSNYTDDIDYQILRQTLQGIAIPDDVIDLVIAFAQAPIAAPAGCRIPERGSVAGMPLSSLMYNVYLNDLDHEMSRRVGLYRRVGDDILLADHSAEKVQQTVKAIQAHLTEKKLTCHPDKTVICQPGTAYEFLGYRFDRGTVSIGRKAARRFLAAVKQRFSPRPHLTAEERVEHIKKNMYHANYSVHQMYNQLLQGYQYIDDHAQIENLSQQVIAIISRYFNNHKKPAGIRRLNQALGETRLPTLFQYYHRLRRGHDTLTTLAVSAA